MDWPWIPLKIPRSPWPVWSWWWLGGQTQGRLSPQRGCCSIHTPRASLSVVPHPGPQSQRWCCLSLCILYFHLQSKAKHNEMRSFFVLLFYLHRNFDSRIQITEIRWSIVNWVQAKWFLWLPVYHTKDRLNDFKLLILLELYVHAWN